MNHLLQRVHPRGDGHEIVEEFGGCGIVLQHELLVAEGVEYVLGGQQPALAIVDLAPINDK